ncbi:MAG TPA: fumarylacetoacetate hydrolase family protein [Pseudolysinimonas sp.]|jgi:2-keto-4-pentenoate hydratase/2-oxohepta-3-ene-1,7-dioic acid hydratase in catechol pathway
MKIVVFGAERRVGLLVDERIVDLAAADATLPADLAGFIAADRRGLDLAEGLVALADDPEHPAVVVAASTVLHAPVVPRPRIACAAGNIPAHTAGTARRKGAEATNALAGLADGRGEFSEADIRSATRERGEPRGFWKDFAIAKGSGDTIMIPARAEQFDYEGEVAVVIARPALDVPSGRGASYFWGVTLLNDWSIRGASRKDSHSFNLGKNFDGGASVGPCIVVGDLDPADMHVTTTVNGDVRQSYSTSDMIFSHAEYLEYLSRDFTFLPGDLISGGSGPGTGTDSGAGFLRPGDMVGVTSAEVGTLSNEVVAKGF